MDFYSRYEFNPKTDLLGRGGSSKVYKANDTLLDRTVALKFFTANLSEKYQVLNEIKKVIRFEHPNLCKYFDVEVLSSKNIVGEMEQTEIGIMEYLDAGDFNSYLKSHPSCLDKLLTGILKGLSYLHKKGVIHRDLKPQNILIKTADGEPVAKITDFGISKLIGEDHISSVLMGTIEYMAPEQFNPKKYGVNGRIATNLDLWSFGVLVYEAIVHKPLFGSRNTGLSAEQVMRNILSETSITEFDDLPSPYREIVKRCLVKDASARVQDAEELISLLNGKTVPEKIEVAGNGQQENACLPSEVSAAPSKGQVPVNHMPFLPPVRDVTDKEKELLQPVQQENHIPVTVPDPATKATGLNKDRSSRQPDHQPQNKKGNAGNKRTYKKALLFIIAPVLLAAVIMTFKHFAASPGGAIAAPAGQPASSSESKGLSVKDRFPETRASKSDGGTQTSDISIPINKSKTVPGTEDLVTTNKAPEVFLTPDVDCSLEINGKAFGIVKAGERKKLTLKPGTHKLLAQSLVTTDVYASNLAIRPGGKNVFSIPLKAVIKKREMQQNSLSEETATTETKEKDQAEAGDTKKEKEASVPANGNIQKDANHTLARVRKISGVETYILCEPLRPYQVVVDAGTGINAESLLTSGLANKSISARVEKFVQNIMKQNAKVDAVIYSAGKRISGIMFTGMESESTRGIGRVSRVMGSPVFVMNEPLDNFEVVNNKRGISIKWKSLITGGVINNSIEEDVELLVKKIQSGSSDAILIDGGNSASAIMFR